MSLPSYAEVLIVGAGPTGLALAVSLAIRGIDAVLVDERPDGQRTSRAAWVHSRTLEMLDTIGCTDRMLARGRKSDKSYVRKGKELLLTSDFEPLATKTQFPYTLILPQNQTEGVLIERLSELGKQVVRSKKVVSVQENEKGTHYDVVFEDEKSIKARYVVGCDGNKSSIRQMMGIRFLDLPQFKNRHTASARSLDKESPAPDWTQITVAEVRISPMPGALATQFNMFVGYGMMAWLPLLNGSVRIIAGMPPGQDLPRVPTVEFMQNLANERAPGYNFTVSEVVWGSRALVKSRIAERYFTPPSSPLAKDLPVWAARAGGVIIIGDAAHTHSPAAGQGMNLGIRDAISLGQALNLHILGEKDAVLRFEEQRQQVAYNIVGLTNKMIYGSTRTGFAGAVRNTLLRIVGRYEETGRNSAFNVSGLNFDK